MTVSSAAADQLVQVSAAASTAGEHGDFDLWADAHAKRQGALIKVLLGIGVMAAFILASLFAPLPQSQTLPDPLAVLQGPSGKHWFGTDQSGLDIFSRTIGAAHYDLLVSIAATAIGTVVGTLLGLLAGLKSRAADVFMRVVDAIQAFPLLILILAVMALSGGGTLILILTIGFVSVPVCIRLVRAESLHIREAKYTEFCAVIGLSRWRIVLRHVLRNVAGIVVVQASLSAAVSVGALAALSFLGYGATPPTPSWGSMIQTGAGNISTGQWWPVVFPAAALVFSVIVFNIIADGVDALLARDMR